MPELCTVIVKQKPKARIKINGTHTQRYIQKTTTTDFNRLNHETDNEQHIISNTYTQQKRTNEIATKLATAAAVITS